MPLFLSGSNGVSGADGTAALPAVQGTDGNTGVFFPAADQVAIATGGVQRLLVDASGNVTTGVGSLYPLVLGTAQNTTSGTSIDFTGIPSWVRRITVMFNGVSTNGTSPTQLQIGASSFLTSGYSGGVGYIVSPVWTAFTTGFGLQNATAAATLMFGTAVMTNLSGNIWIYTTNSVNGNNSFVGAGSAGLSGTLDRVRITTVGGTDTFDAGSINILYE